MTIGDRFGGLGVDLGEVIYGFAREKLIWSAGEIDLAGDVGDLARCGGKKRGSEERRTGSGRGRETPAVAPAQAASGCFYLVASAGTRPQAKERLPSLSCLLILPSKILPTWNILEPA